MVPAAMFYNDTLEAAAEDVVLIKWSGLPNPSMPIAFYENESEESWIDEVSTIRDEKLLACLTYREL
jgi:hypothetical protein